VRINLWQNKPVLSYGGDIKSIEMDCLSGAAGADMDLAVAHPFLSAVYFAFYAAIMPIHSHLFGICTAGHQEAWTLQGALFGDSPFAQMPSVGRKRL
jgi:hypothetical protein